MMNGQRLPASFMVFPDGFRDVIMIKNKLSSQPASHIDLLIEHEGEFHYGIGNLNEADEFWESVEQIEG